MPGQRKMGIWKNLGEGDAAYRPGRDSREGVLGMHSAGEKCGLSTGKGFKGRGLGMHSAGEV